MAMLIGKTMIYQWISVYPIFRQSHCNHQISPGSTPQVQIIAGYRKHERRGRLEKKKHVTPGHINLEGPNCAMTSVDFGGKLSIIFWEKSPNGQLGWPMIDPGDTVIP